jgi:uncharacterized membrane protein
MKVSKMISIILFIIFIGQIIYFYPQLPETIASHFNVDGQANGFMSKSSFFAFEVILLAFLSVMFLSMAKLIAKLPDSMINLPNKDYWLSTERREQTFAAFDNFFAWLIAGIIALFIAINQIALIANLAKKDLDQLQFWIVLGTFFVLIAVLIFVYLKQFFGTKTV